jgi:ribosomal protein S18 acetylase RimI-like enzyme
MNEEAPIEFGRPTAADLPAVVELCMLVEEQHEKYWPLRWERRPGLADGYLGWLTRRLAEPRMFVEVGRDAGEVVGMIIVTVEKEVPIYTYSEYAYVQDMAVRESHRRRGIAQQLVADAAAWARDQGLNQLRLMVASQNPAAQAAFEKAGFRKSYQEMVLPVGE